MANISAELEAIMAAVFGRDVRKSIHDAIYKINVASEVQMNAGTAITSATSSSAGFTDGSLYINTNTYELWRCIGVNTWQSLGILKGTDGRAISSISGPVTSGITDTYTINYSDGTSSTFTVTNGVDGKDGSIWYRGTAFTTTGSGLTGFPGKEHDFYLNPTLGYVYQCTRTGDATTALWEYAMAITGGGGGSIVVIDNLNNTSSTDALSANQGHNLDLKKIEKPANPNVGDMIQWDGTDWIAVPEPEGHPMSPDPTSTKPQTAAAREAAIVSAVQAGRTTDGDGWTNDEVPSLNTIGRWSNTMSKTYTVSGTSVDSPIGITGIGTWYDGDEESIDPSTDEADWISIPELIGIGANSDIDFKLVFDPSTSSIPIVLGGYIIDDTTGKMCIKFANEIEEEDTETAVVGIEMIYKRTDTIPVSFN